MFGRPDAIASGRVVQAQRLAASLCMLLSSLLIGTVSPMAEDITRTTFDGIPLEEPIRFRIRGSEYRIPAGYLAPWPTQTVRNVVSDTDAISFNFWMPDRRYVEVDDRSLAEY